MALFNDLPNEIQARILSEAVETLPRRSLYDVDETTRLLPSIEMLDGHGPRYKPVLAYALVNKHFSELMTGIVACLVQRERKQAALLKAVFGMAYTGGLRRISNFVQLRRRFGSDFYAVAKDQTPSHLSVEDWEEIRRVYKRRPGVLEQLGLRRSDIWLRILETELAPFYESLRRQHPSSAIDCGTASYNNPGQAKMTVMRLAYTYAVSDLTGRELDIIAERLRDEAEYEYEQGRTPFDDEMEEEEEHMERVRILMGDYDDETDSEEGDSDIYDDYDPPVRLGRSRGSRS